MGYFSNGTEGMSYEEMYCSRCQHLPVNPDNGGCAVWLAHLLHNSEGANNPKHILHLLIPQNERGFNDQCKMFIARPGEEDPNQTKLFTPSAGGR